MPDRPEDASVGEAFIAVATRRADHAAVVDPSGETTYRRLHAQAAAVAPRLAGLPVRHGPVLILGGHRAGTLAAMLGSALAGSPYLVLDHRSPTTALRAVVDRHGARALVVASDGTSGAGFDAARAEHIAAGAPVVVLDDGEPAAAGLPPRVDPASAASVVFTSGSAGVPKAVVHAHRTVVANARHYAASIDAGPGDRVLVVSPLSTAAAATPVYAALLTGAAVVLHDVHGPGLAGFADAATGASVVHLVPAVVSHLPDPPPGGVPSVRIVALGGDRADAAQVGRVRAWFPNAAVLHRYSTSETNQIAVHGIAPDASVPPGRLPTGRPLPWVHVRVVGADGLDVAIGAVGEVLVASDTLALGYLDDPARTAARFVVVDANRTYRTGDRARWLPDGGLELVGRVDDLVKIGAELVDPGRAEVALAQVPGVAQAAVVATGDPVALTAFVAGPVRPVQVRAEVACRLPSALVPARVVVLPALPVTDRGKVDRAYLAEVASRSSRPTYREPTARVEGAIAAAFEQVLGVDRIGRDDDCFALGADSLTAEELASRLGPVLGRRVDAATLLAHPTPTALAGWAQQGAGPSSAAAQLVPIAAGPSDVPPAVFFSGGSGAHVDGVAQVARAMVARDCFAVLPRAFAARGRPDLTIAQMATTAAGLIREALPGRPVVLVGHSVGGTVVVEVARQLVAAGAGVIAVVLLDTRATTVQVVADRGLWPDLRRALADNLAWRQSRGLGSSWLRRGYWVPRYGWRRVRRRLRAGTAGWVPRSGRAQHRAFEALLKEAVRGWADSDCAAPVIVVRASGGSSSRAADGSAAATGWDGVLSRTPVVVSVPGTHSTMTSGQFAVSTAQAIDAALAAMPGSRSGIA